MKRITGALIRALIVVLIIIFPALLLPDMSKTAQELALIVGVIVAGFTMFEYASKNPGFVDFRFAPPYNRFRIAIIAAQVTALSLICRATIENIPQILAFADIAAGYATFPFSPVDMALDKTFDIPLATDPELMRRLFSASFVIAVGLVAVLGGVLWFLGWPMERSEFNLWLNLPTFSPSSVARAGSRMKRDAGINIMLGVVLIYTIPFGFPYIVETLGAGILEDNHSLVWVVSLWAFLPALLITRGIAITKVNRILSKALKNP